MSLPLCLTHPLADLNKQEHVALPLGRWPSESLCFLFPAYTDTDHMFLLSTAHTQMSLPGSL